MEIWKTCLVQSAWALYCIIWEVCNSFLIPPGSSLFFFEQNFMPSFWRKVWMHTIDPLLSCRWVSLMQPTAQTLVATCSWSWQRESARYKLYACCWFLVNVMLCAIAFTGWCAYHGWEMSPTTSLWHSSMCVMGDRERARRLRSPEMGRNLGTMDLWWEAGHEKMKKSWLWVSVSGHVCSYMWSP